MDDLSPTMNNVDMIRALQSRLEELAMTPAELARLTGLSRRTLNACLSGHTEISARLLLRIATALQLRLQLVPDPGCENAPEIR
jgi:plasmid maintenance system antidote protein VapI